MKGNLKLAAGALALIALLGVAAYLYRNRTREMIPVGNPEIEIYVDQPAATAENLALYEPAAGCYLGAYIDLEPALKTEFRDGTNRRRKLPSEFEEKVGKKHALYFIYMLYGSRLPVRFIDKLRDENRFIQIALEPNRGLDEVKDDQYLHDLADQLAATKAKIFIRFASEMNGDWTKYHGNPALYIEKWRLITRVMRERAPNVAMIWCPYTVPRSLVEAYYPGDEWVDWIGVNMYSATYYNRDWRFPGLDDHPADLLSHVYDLYSARKPIMICEYGAANYSALEDEHVPQFAIDNIRALYWSLPRRFPRVKCVTYFSGNNMLVAHRKNNDYSLLSKPDVLNAYQDAVATSYFTEEPMQSPGSTPQPLEDGQKVAAGEPVTIWARSPERSCRVQVKLNGRVIYDKSGIEHRFAWPGGTGEIVCQVLDKHGRTVVSETLTVG